MQFPFEPLQWIASNHLDFVDDQVGFRGPTRFLLRWHVAALAFSPDPDHFHGTNGTLSRISWVPRQVFIGNTSEIFPVPRLHGEADVSRSQRQLLGVATGFQQILSGHELMCSATTITTITFTTTTITTAITTIILTAILLTSTTITPPITTILTTVTWRPGALEPGVQAIRRCGQTSPGFLASCVRSRGWINGFGWWSRT